MKIDDLNVDNSTKIYLDKINLFLDTYAPLKKINKYKLKIQPKPWITLGLQKSIFVKNKLKEIGIILRTHGKEPNPLFL